MFLFHFLIAIIAVCKEPTPNYKVKYKLVYSPDSTSLEVKNSENFLLIIKEGKSSYFSSENFLKRDSISRLVKNGLLTVSDITNNPSNRFSTKFTNFIYKDYNTKINKSYEFIGLTPYKFLSSLKINWELTDEKSTVSGYKCFKALTNYTGRKYEAWYTPDIPFSDGPYLFAGLPGLIVKINDTESHYTFTLTEFTKYNGVVTEVPTFRKQQPIEINQSKAFSLREEYRVDPFNYLNRTTGGYFNTMTFQKSGSSEAVPIKTMIQADHGDNNPLELKWIY